MESGCKHAVGFQSLHYNHHTDCYSPFSGFCDNLAKPCTWGTQSTVCSAVFNDQQLGGGAGVRRNGGGRDCRYNQIKAVVYKIFTVEGQISILGFTEYTFCLKYSIPPLQLESSHTKYINESACPNKILLTKRVGLDLSPGPQFGIWIRESDLNAVFFVCFQLY